MNRKSLTIVVLCVLILSGLTSRSSAQTTTPSPTPTPIAPVDIVYTGRLLGYFRTPSLQKIDQGKGCPARSNADSDAAREFFKFKRQPNSILVGTGDNFAPQLEARIFEDPPKSSAYSAGNKELFFGDGDAKWIPYDSDKHEPLLQRIAEGYGTIPTDNVGCFLRAAKFDAVVPGKHDFYFGPERVRQFARFLAGTHTENDSHPVQMLGANLVLKTNRNGAAPSAKIEQPGIGDWPTEYTVANLKEGKAVYPWFTYVKIQLAELKPDDKRQLHELTSELSDIKDKQLFLCHTRGGPNEMPADFKKECKWLNDGEIRRVGNKILHYLKLPDPNLADPKLRDPEWPDHKNLKNGHEFKLLAGRNYGLCMEYVPKAVPKDGSKNVSEKRCLRFSSHIPFFYFPHVTPLENTDSYTDPDPYVLKDQVAIFGVVDPALNEQVGILNFGWKHSRSGLTTRVSAEDPADALQQQFDYFEARHPKFHGVRILLAQMNPQHARALAAHFPDVQVVVAAADQEQATSQVTLSTVWDPNRHKRAFVAVPAPYFDSTTRKGSVHFGTIKVSEVSDSKFELVTDRRDPVEVAEKEDPADEFWKLIRESGKCSPEKFKSTDNPADQERLKWLVLCAMRDHTSAAVALIQKRDLFNKIPLSPKHLPKKPGDSPNQIGLNNLQQTLDRLIWKGDLVTLLYLRGSDLKKVLQQSDKYAAEEAATLSLSVERGRQLETLGIRKEKDEYFINDLPLKDTETYPVATTDYIGAGDTGYPELVKATLNARTEPAHFKGDLVPISSLVCRMLIKDQYDTSKYCLGPLISESYLDHSTAKQLPPYKQPSFFKKVGKFLASGWPDGATDATTHGEAIEQTVQRRDTWRISLQSLSFSFKGLDNNMSDDEVDEKFAGIPLSTVTSKEKQTYNFALNARISRSSHKRELFIEPRLEYDREYLGDDPDELDTNQLKNKASAEAGFVFWRRPGRAVPNFGANVSLYLETQVQHPFRVFSLATGEDKIRISQRRSLLLMPRVGFRWQARANFWEVGLQRGREFRAPNGYLFNTNGVLVTCEPNAAVSFAKCIENNSNPATGGSITEKSEVTALRQTRPRAGLYWKLGFSRPFGAKIKYELTGTGDFFRHFAEDTPIDTRLRSDFKHSLNFIIWPSLSIGPTWEWLLYRNQINKDFLFQKQLGMELKISFDLFNRRDIRAQLKNKP